MQLEDNIRRLDQELKESREHCDDLRARLNQKDRDISEMNAQIESSNKDSKAREAKLLAEIKASREEKEGISGEVASFSRLEEELQASAEQKKFLQSRHDALTIESQGLQADLDACHQQIEELHCEIEQQRRSTLEDRQDLQERAEREIEHVSRSLREAQDRLRLERNEAATRDESWAQKIRKLELQKDAGERDRRNSQKAHDKTQEHDTTSGKRILQQESEHERQRHQNVEARTAQQLEELRADHAGTLKALERAQSDLRFAREDMRSCQQSRQASDKKMQALEDEVNVLQGALDEDADKAKECTAKLRREIKELNQQQQMGRQEIARARTAQREAEAEAAKLKSERRDAELVTKVHEQAHKKLEHLVLRQGEMDQMKVACEEASAQAERRRSVEEEFAKVRTSREDAQTEARRLRLELAATREQNEHLRDELRVWRSKKTFLDRDEAAPAHQEQPGLNSSKIGENSKGLSLRGKITVTEREKGRLQSHTSIATQPASPTGQSLHEARPPDGLYNFCDSRELLNNFLAESRESDQNALRRIADLHKLSEQQFDSLENQREQLELQLGKLQNERMYHQADTEGVEATMRRMRNRIKKLEEDLKSALTAKQSSGAMVAERKDLHDLLKTAKLDAEHLQLQIDERETLLQAASAREESVLSQLREVQSESRLKQKQAVALSEEIGNLQKRYEDKVDAMAAKQWEFEQERHKLQAGMESFNAVGESRLVRKLEVEAEQRESRHAAERKKMARQIQQYRIRYMREATFRESLAFGKRYLLLQVEMYQAW